MDRVVAALSAVHRRLLSAFEAKGGVERAMLLESVPQLVGLIEDRVPSTATILRPEDVRELCTQLVVDVLDRQAEVLEGSQERARKRPSVAPAV